MTVKDYYKINSELVNCGWKSDETGVYIPYLFKNEDNPDPREVYLKISRLPTEDTHFEYTWVKLHKGHYYKLSSSAIGNNPVNTEAPKFIRSIILSGNHATLDSGEGSYKHFYADLKDKITECDCLDILKEEEYEFEYPQKSELTEGQEILNELHTIDMRKLASKLLDDGYLVKHYNNPYKPYDHYKCPWHDDKEPSAMAYEQLFICTSTNCDVGKLDQEAFIKKVFNVEEPVDVLHIFIKLFM